MGALFERSLVGLDESTGFVGKGQRQGLQATQFNTLAEDDVVGDLVERSGQLFMADHLADDGRRLGTLQLKHGAECFESQCVIERGVCKQVCTEPFLLDLLGKHVLDVLGIGHQFPNLDAVDEGGRLLPLAGGKSLGRLHDVVSCVLGGASEYLSLVVLEHTSIGLANDTLPDIRRRSGLGQQRNLKKHAAGQIYALQKLQVDVHVEGQLALLLQALLLGGYLAVSLHHNTLSQQFLLTARATDVLEGVLSIVNETLAERTQANLDKGSVVEDLRLHVEIGYGVLQVGHEHHVTSLVVLPVKSKEVNLGQHGTGTNNAVTVVEQVVAEDVDQIVSIFTFGARGDDGVNFVTGSLCAILLKGLDDLCGLYI